MSVWLDLCSEDSPVPAVEQEIRVKVTRNSWHEGKVADLSRQTQGKLAKQIDMYVMQNDAERQVGSDVPTMGAYMNQGLSMLGSIGSSAKTVLGGVANQVANSMPAPQ